MASTNYIRCNRIKISKGSVSHNKIPSQCWWFTRLYEIKNYRALRITFKDEVRRVGKTLKIDDFILGRHPFPGPGLGIEYWEIYLTKLVVTRSRFIFINSLRGGLYNSIWQAGAILLPVQVLALWVMKEHMKNVLF